MSLVTIDSASEKTLERASLLLAGVDGGIETAIKNAMSRAVSHLRKNTEKAVRERYAISAENVKSKNNVSVTYSVGSGVQAEILFRGTKIPLAKYDGASTTPGWSDETMVFKTSRGFIHGHPGVNGVGHVLASTGPQRLDGTFVANFSSGHAGIFERTGAATDTGSDKISEKMGLSVPQMLGSEEVEQKLGEEAMEKFDERLQHEVDRLLAGW